MATNLPSVPSIPGNLDPQLMQVLSAMKANIEAIGKGNVAAIAAPTDAITNAQLSGAIAEAVDLFKDPPDLEPPIALDSLVVVGGILFNMLTWGDLPGNIDHIRIYRAAGDDRTAATVIGTTQFCIWADYIPEGVNTRYFYWIRGVSKAGILGSWNLVNGSVSTAGTSAVPLGIGDQQVGTISASKIYCLTLAALSANLGNKSWKDELLRWHVSGRPHG
jgi:predicted phage tail protein